MALFDERGARRFLAQYWQRSPLFIPAALDDVPAAIDWRALAGDERVESRRVARHGNDYRLAHGPFDATQLEADSATPWTVLIQDAEHHAPALRALLDHFDFLPRWRLEDVMLSYATDGASVGPHVDQYDVFLVQATGRRRWQVGAAESARPRSEDGGLRLVEQFDAQLEVVAAPGDVLYLPPGVPHHGVAEGECITLSVGFRAPSTRELLAVLLEETPAPGRFADAGRQAVTHAGELDQDSIDRAAILLRGALTVDNRLAATCLGRLVTEPKEWLHPEEPDDPPDAGALRAAIEQGAGLSLCAATRVAIATEEALLFVNGEAMRLPPALLPGARRMAAAQSLTSNELESVVRNAEALQFLTRLVASGAIYLQYEH